MSGTGARKANTTGRTTGKTKPHRPLVELPSGQFLQVPRELLDSPALQAISGAALRCLLRLSLEHLAHGGAENGRLKVTHKDFVRYGVGHNSVKSALLELEAVGLIEVVRQGGKSYGDTSLPSLYRLTFPQSRNMPATHEWHAIKSPQEAERLIADHKRDYAQARPPRPQKPVESDIPQEAKRKAR